jgi:ureidoacrylate peracid hydrolase
MSRGMSVSAVIASLRDRHSEATACKLKRHGIHKLIVVGQKANTCIEATVRYAAELGYDVTLVKDAIASYNWEEMRTTLEINLPNYATSILSAADTIAALEHTSVLVAA